MCSKQAIRPPVKLGDVAIAIASQSQISPSSTSASYGASFSTDNFQLGFDEISTPMTSNNEKTLFIQQRPVFYNNY